MLFACVPFILGAFVLVAWNARLDRATRVPAELRA
jgi:hypothetical protein